MRLGQSRRGEGIDGVAIRIMPDPTIDVRSLVEVIKPLTEAVRATVEALPVSSKKEQGTRRAAHCYNHHDRGRSFFCDDLSRRAF